jgi:DNA-binding Xre family transcriptional regulator
MIILQVKELLKERGRSVRWLWKETGIRYPSLLDMRRRKTVRLDLVTVELLCRALQAEPNELFLLRPKVEESIKNTRALLALRRKNNATRRQGRKR